MSDEGDKKPTRAIKIVISKCTNLRGTKGEACTSLVRVEFGQTFLGESGKVETNKETKMTEYKYMITLDCTFDDPYSLDGICQKPIVVIVAEVLPKDKKSKEEKTLPLGQCCIDLLPLLKGSKAFTVTKPLTSLVQTQVFAELVTTEADQPELEVSISVNEPLLTTHELNESNILTFQMDSAYSVPDSWSSGTQSYNYCISLPIPITAQKENIVTIPNGLLRAASEKEANQKRKWSVGPTTSGVDLFIDESYVDHAFPDEEQGDLQDDLNFRRNAQFEKPRVTWNSERRCFLSLDASLSFQKKVANNRIWPVEITRQPTTATVKTRAGKQQSTDEEPSISFHGVAYVNMAPLLYPGIKMIQGAYLVRPYIENEVLERTKRKANVSDDSEQMSGALNRNTPSVSVKNVGSKMITKDTKVKQSMAALKAEPNSEGDIADPESQQYNEARTFITIKIELDKPLVARKPPSALAKKVAEIIPPRAIFSKKSGGAKKAIENYHTQIVNVANLLLNEFRHLNGGDFGSLSQENEDVENRRKAFLYELNTSGKYFAFKEQMKNAVIKIVREKYFHTTSFTNQEELQSFLSDLYVFLVDEMHKGLNKALTVDEKTEIPTSMADNEMLKHFAQEAEVKEDYELAAKYYKERLGKNQNDPDCWFDYGAYCLLIRDVSKAEECFREVISLNQKHFKGLLLNGCVSLMTQKYEEAETFFEAATCQNEKSVIAWTTLGLFYDSFQNDIGAERAFHEATRANTVSLPRNTMPVLVVKNPSSRRASLDDTNGRKQRNSTSKIPKNASNTQTTEHIAVDAKHDEIVTSGEVTVPSPTTPRSIFLQNAVFLLNVNATMLAESSLAHELLTNGPSALYYTLLARLHVQKRNYEEAEADLNEALKLDHKSSNAWSLLGHVNYLTHRMDKASMCYERALAYIDEPTDIHTVYIRLASIYLKERQFVLAKKHFLMACQRSPSPCSWLGVGISCYELDLLNEAEDALSEANILNNTDAEIWGYLSLLCLKTGRKLEAEQSYKYAIKLKLQNKELLSELHAMQEKVGFGNPTVA